MKKIKHILLNAGDSNDRQTFIAEDPAVAIDAAAQVTLLSVLDTPPEDQQSVQNHSIFNSG